MTTSVRITGTKNLGGTTAATRYAYGDIDMFFDSTIDAFRPTGYLRRVALVSTTDFGDLGTQTAQIVDNYPLDPISPLTLQILTDAQRFGRYLRVGRPRDVTTLAGSLGTSANALLSVNVDTDPRRISGAHHEAVTSDTHVFTDSTAAAGTDCFDLAFPYDAHLSKLYAAATYKPCAARGFLLTQSTSTWRGSAAPPSSANVQTATSVRSVDDLGRVTSAIYYNDLFRSDDDVCVDTKYAASATQLLPSLTAVASRKVWACTKGGEVLAEESWDYDGFPTGFALAGLPSSHTVHRHTGDTGAYLSTVREFDATYDAAANPVSIVSTRDDGVKRTVELAYDEFGMFAQSTSVGGTGVPTLTTSRTFDPVTGDLLETKDPNGTVRGTTFDGFGRPVFDTIATPETNQTGVLTARSYIGFDTLDPDGRRVLVKELTDPAAPSAVKTAPGRQSTTFFDELGRPRRSKVELGEDYAREVMIVGARTYDVLGRVVFEADAYPETQDGTTAYGTSMFFDVDGSLMGQVRGAGPQAYATTPSAAVERFPTLFRHTFANHIETTTTQTADALTAGLPQNGVTKEAAVTAIGRVLTRSTWKAGVRLEHEALGYDQLGQFSSIIRYQNAAAAADPVTTTMQLDSVGQLLWLKEPTSAPQERTYSSWGELRSVTTYPSFLPSRTEAMKYDALGRLLASEEVNGGVADPDSGRYFQYDAPGASAFAAPTYTAGRLASASTPTGEVVVSYDGQGRTNARTYRDTQTQQKYFEQMRFHGDGSQAWVELQLPDNAFKPERMDYDYDTAGRLRWMWFSDGSNTQELYNASTIDPWGRTRKATFGKTSYAAAYADLGRRLPDTLDISSPNGIRSLRFTGFDPVGRELSREEDLPSSPGTTIQSYDPLGRLQGARRQLGTATTSFWTFSYDALGNVAMLDDQLGTADATINFLAADRDQICAVSYGGVPGACNVEHDGFGNIVKYPTRSGFSRLSYFNSGDVRTIENESGVTAKFDYDAFGDVANLSIFRGGTLLRRDRHYGAFITERAQKDQASTLYVSRRFPGPGVALSRRGPTGPWIYEFSESNGTRITTDENGKFVQDLSYTPFGAVTSTGAKPGTPEYTTDQWNSGDALDGFGLVRLGKRIYDPAIGRFLSRDPLLIPRTSATTNPYAFAHNDPTNLADPSGLDPCSGSPTCRWDLAVNEGPGAVARNALLSFAAKAGATAGSRRSNATAQQRFLGSTALAVTALNLGWDSLFAVEIEKALMNLRDRPLVSENWILFAGAAPVVGLRGLAYVAMGHGVISAPDEGTAFLGALGLTGGKLGLGERPSMSRIEVLDAAETTIEATSQKFVYRGYHAKHPKLEQAKKGRVEPGDPEGSVTPEEHSEFGDDPEVVSRSPLTSWTHDPEVAKLHALKQGPGGVILRLPTGAPPPGALWSWEWSPMVWGAWEQEVFLRGVREGAKVGYP